MPIFGWGKKSESAKPESKAPANPAAGADEPYSPAKAESLFAYARQADERDNPEYAMSLWLSGLRADPMKHEAVPAFFQSAARYRNAQGKGAKQAAAVIKGNTDLDKYLSSLLAWSLDPQSAELAVRATTAAVKLGLNESVKWLAERALALNAQADRPRKENLLNLMNIFHEAGNNELAVQAGELALRLDPADNNLRADVRDLAAQSSIDKGGYEQTTGQSGGFRSNVRDLDKQRKIEENERIVKTDEVAARVIAAARAAYLASPSDKPLIRALIERLRERGTPEDFQEAERVAEKAYTDTQEFSFRKQAGEIRMRAGVVRLRELRQASEQNPGDEAARARLEEAEARQKELEIVEYAALVKAYPTDLKLKYELGVRNLRAGHFEAAIEQLQQAKSDGTLKQKAIMGLGLAFQSLGWDEEAVETFREGLANITDLQNDPMSLDFRYALMASLQKLATEHRDLARAEEAGKIAQAIGMQQITYRDIRNRRDQIKALVASLKQ